MEIKTSLKKLISLFVGSANNEELAMPIRQFAAQLTILTAHVQRVEAKISAFELLVGAQVAELATHIMTVREKAPVANPAAAAAAAAAAGSDGALPPPSAVEEASSLVDLTEEEATAAMVAQVQRETEADVAAVKAEKPTAITPLRKANAGGKKASNAGDAA